MEKVLIIGIAGANGELLAQRLTRDYEVVGVDRIPWSGRRQGIAFHRTDIRSRAFENVLRTVRPDAVVHLGFVRHFREDAAERYDINVRGTRKLLNHCQTFGVSRVLVNSTSYVYGALPENPSFMDEEYPPAASRNYPEIRDLVELDTIAAAFMWKYPEIKTSILRPVPILGPGIENSMRSYLQMRRSICMMGFNPMMQFLHESDLCDAFALALAGGIRGVFNVTGPGEVPLRLAIRESGGAALPLPEPLARPLLARLFRMGLFPFPPGAIDYIKYPCTLSGERFVSATGFRPSFGLRETLHCMEERRT